MHTAESLKRHTLPSPLTETAAYICAPVLPHHNLELVHHVAVDVAFDVTEHVTHDRAHLPVAVVELLGE